MELMMMMGLTSRERGSLSVLGRGEMASLVFGTTTGFWIAIHPAACDHHCHVHQLDAKVRDLITGHGGHTTLLFGGLGLPLCLWAAGRPHPCEAV